MAAIYHGLAVAKPDAQPALPSLAVERVTSLLSFGPNMVLRKPKVLVAMSGGVDSSVAAALLLRDGYEVVGCFMRLGSPGESFDELVEDAASDDPSEQVAGACRSGRIRIGH